MKLKTKKDTEQVFHNGDAPQPKNRRYSKIDLFNDLRSKHGKKGGNFFDWLRRERDEQAKSNQDGGNEPH